MIIGQKHRVETDRNERNILFYFFFRFDFSTFNNEQPFIRENAMKIRRMLRPIVCTCVSRKMLRVKSSKGWKKNAWERESSPTHKGCCPLSAIWPLFFFTHLCTAFFPHDKGNHSRVRARVCLQLYMDSVLASLKVNNLFFFFFVTTYNNKNEQPSFASGGNFSLSLGIYKYK